MRQSLSGAALVSDPAEPDRFTPVNDVVDPDFFTPPADEDEEDEVASAAAASSAELSRMTVSITSASKPHSKRLYHSTCASVSGTNTVNSRRDGNVMATWSFTRRSMKIPSMRRARRSCRESITPRTRSKPVSNFSAVANVNTSVARKCSRAHNSRRLFCNGVPVRMILLSDETERNFSLNWLRSFFKRWPSSTMIVVHTYFRLKKFTSETSISKVVTTMSNSFVSDSSSDLMRARSDLGPWNRTARNDGQNFSISASQLDRTDKGTTTKCGPPILFSARWARNPMDWIV